MNIETQPIQPENLFQIIFEKSPGSLLVKADTPRFTILAASDTYLNITGSTREAIIGKGFFEVFPDNAEDLDDDTKARKVFTNVISSGKKCDVPTYRFDIFDPVEDVYNVHYWSCSNTPIKSGDNKVAYILNTVVDITGEVKAKQAAIESESRLRLAADATALATWDLNLNDLTFIYSPRLTEIFGHTADKPLTLADIRSQVNADDMTEIVRKAYFKALKTGNYLYEVRIYLPDSSLRWIKTQGVVINDDNGKPQRLLGTILDITESKRDEIRKNDFIAMASHELKTPLTSLKAYIQLLAKRTAKTDDSFTSNALWKAGRQINKMTDLIHGFLDLSKLESGKLQVKMQLFDMNSAIDDIISETVVADSSHKVVFDPVGEILVYADEEKIGQVVNNFLSNAIKYSPKGSTIFISCIAINNSVQVAVKDQGIGINKKDQEKLFQRFYRVNNESVKNISGFGIGLYLANEIILRHKGKIWVESEDGQGSTFYFNLPLRVNAENLSSVERAQA